MGRFVSNYFASAQGFKLEYETTYVRQWSYNFGNCEKPWYRPGPTEYFRLPFGIATSPSYPEKYPSDADCTYIIQTYPRDEYQIRLKIFFIDILGYGGRYTNYQRDYLEIREGTSENSPILHRYKRGDKEPTTLNASRGVILMR